MDLFHIHVLIMRFEFTILKKIHNLKKEKKKWYSFIQDSNNALKLYSNENCPCWSNLLLWNLFEVNLKLY
jgi:hypothetical protein